MSKHALRYALAVACILTASEAPTADGWVDVYACGASKGHSYFFKGDDWQSDGISKGVIILKRRGTEFDIEIGDASGKSYSAREDGATVTGRDNEGMIQVVAVYPRLTIETYLFSKPVEGRSTLAWTSSKQGSFAGRVSAFVSSCLAR
jgi:hypothetical protein